MASLTELRELIQVARGSTARHEQSKFMLNAHSVKKDSGTNQRLTYLAGEVPNFWGARLSDLIAIICKYSADGRQDKFYAVVQFSATSYLSK